MFARHYIKPDFEKSVERISSLVKQRAVLLLCCNFLPGAVVGSIIRDDFLYKNVKYRSRMDIAAAMLDISQDGAIKTRIMYSAFLSFPQLKEYLGLLTDAGLLEHAEKEREYHTTDKGKRFLRMYQEVDAMVPRDNMLTKVMPR